MVNRVVCLCAMLMLAGFSTVLGVDDSDAAAIDIAEVEH